MSSKTDENDFNLGFRYFLSVMSTTQSPPFREHRSTQNQRLTSKSNVEETISNDSQKYDSLKSLYLQNIPKASVLRENFIFPYFESPIPFKRSGDNRKTTTSTIRMTQKHTRTYKTSLFTEAQYNIPEKDSIRSNRRKRKDSTVERNRSRRYSSIMFIDTQDTVPERHSLKSNKKKRRRSTTERRHTGWYKSTSVIDTEDIIPGGGVLRNNKQKKSENKESHHHTKKKRIDHQLKTDKKSTTLKTIVQNNKNEKPEDIATFSNDSFNGQSLYVESINHYNINFTWVKKKKTTRFDYSLQVLLPSTMPTHKPLIQGHVRNKTKKHSKVSHKHNTTRIMTSHTTSKRKEKITHKLAKHSKTTDKKLTKNVVNKSDRTTRLTKARLSNKDIKKSEKETASKDFKHAINTTSEPWQPEHKLKDEIYTFLKQIFTDKLEILRAVEDNTLDIGWKMRIKNIAKSYETRFFGFINNINDKLRSKSGTERVILHSIDMSNRPVMRVIRFVADEKDKRGLMYIAKTMEERTKSELKQACTNFGVCRRSSAFTEFVINFMTIVLSLDDAKFEEVYNILSKYVENTDFTNTIGYYADQSLKQTAKKYKNESLTYKRETVEMLRNIIANRHTPLAIYGDNDNFDVTKTLAFIEIINILDNAVPDSEENVTKWHQLNTELSMYAKDEKAVHIEATFTDFGSHIKNVIDHTDSKSWNGILTQANIIIK